MRAAVSRCSWRQPRRLIIYRDTDIVQETDYISGDPFPAETTSVRWTA